MKKELLYGVGGLIIGSLISATVIWTVISNQPNTDTMMHDMSATEGKTGDTFDKVYLSTMISHLEMSVDLAKKAELSAKHDQLKNAATQLVTTQSHQIDEMKSWQMQWGYTIKNMDHSQMNH